MNRKHLWLRIRRVWVTVGVSATVIFVGWSLVAFRPSDEARAAVRSDSTVIVGHEGGVWHFTPSHPSTVSAVGLLFFPGSLVNPVAYAPLARAAAAAGVPAYIVELPRRGAFGGARDPALFTRLRTLFASAGAPARWVIAGHSLGGVVTSQVAATGIPGLAGVVLIGTSHPRDVDLSALQIPVTKIVGTRDDLASPAEVEANRHKLPPSTRWVWVEGGNHSQFGWYGFQPMDRFATISRSAQHAIMIDAVLDALRRAAVH